METENTDATTFNKDVQSAVKLLQKKHGDKATQVFTEFYELLKDKQQSQEEAYVKHVLYPFEFPPVRQPSLFPQQTGLYRHNFCMTTGANELGSFDVMYLPTGEIDDFKLLIGTEDSTVPGTYNTLSTYFKNIDVATYCKALRLVSAYVKIEYIGKQDDLAGFWQAGWEYIQGAAVVGGSRMSAGQPLIPLSVIQDMNGAANGTVQDNVIMVHLPLPDSDEFYSSTADQDHNGVHVFYYFSFRGVPVNPNAFKLTVQEIYEYIPATELRDWMVQEQQLTGDLKKAQNIIDKTVQNGYKQINTEKDHKHWYEKIIPYVKNAAGSLLTAGGATIMKTNPILGGAMGMFGNTLYSNT